MEDYSHKLVRLEIEIMNMHTKLVVIVVLITNSVVYGAALKDEKAKIRTFAVIIMNPDGTHDKVLKTSDISKGIDLQVTAKFDKKLQECVSSHALTSSDISFDDLKYIAGLQCMYRYRFSSSKKYMGR